MKFKLTKFLVALGLTATLLSGCVRGRRGSKSSSSSDSGSEREDDCYYGDDSKTIGKITNIPTTQYSSQTEQKLRTMYSLMSSSEEQADQFIDYLISAHIGDELAAYFADWYTDMYNMGFNSFVKFDIDALGNNGERLSDVMYGGLTIINSMEISNLTAIFDRINEDNAKSAQEDLNNSSIFKYLGDQSQYHGMSYTAYEKAKEIKNQVNSADLNAFITSYESYLDGYHFAESDAQRYENYLQDLRDRINRAAVPQIVINFLNNHGDTIKRLLLTDIKAFVDGFVDITPVIMSAVKKANQVSAHADGYRITADPFETVREVFNGKKSLLIKFLRTLLATNEIDNLLIDGVLEIFIPMMLENLNLDSEQKDKLNLFERRVRGLSGTHIKALINFILEVIDKAYSDDVIELLTYLFSGKIHDFDFLTFGQRNSKVLDDVIRSLNGETKSKITEFSAIFGIDLIHELQSLIDIFNKYDPKSESFMEAISTWGQNISTNAYDALFSIFAGSTGKSARPDNGIYNDYFQLHVGLYDYQYVQGENINANDFFYIDLYCRQPVYYSLYSRYGNFNNTVENEAAYYSSIENPSEDERLRAEVLSTLSLSITNLSVDTTYYGRADYSADLRFTYLDGVYSLHLQGVVNIAPAGNNRIYFGEYVYNAVTNYHGMYLVLNTSNPFVGNNGTVYLNVSKLGWNVYVEQPQGEYDNKVILLYYVATESELRANIRDSYYSYGIMFSDDKNNFHNSPYSSTTYLVDNYFNVYASRSLEASQVTDKTLGNHRIVVDGFTFYYTVIDVNSYFYLGYELNLASLLQSGIAHTPSATVQGNYTMHYTYTTHTGAHSTCGRGSSTSSYSIYNFDMQDSKLTFEFMGQNYSFLVSEYY